MKITKIAFVVFPVSDIARARTFYEDVLQLRPSRIFEKDGRGSIDYDLEGGERITIRCEGLLPATNAPRVTVALAVDNFNDVIATLRASKVLFVSAPAEISGACQATVNDPDGNCITIHKTKDSSKKDFVVI